MTDLDRHVAAIASGDTHAFAAWVAGAEPWIRARLAGFAACVDTEAVLQEALLRVWQVAPRFEPDGRPDGLLRLAFRLARNLAITEARRRRTATVDPATLANTVAIEPPAPDPLLAETIRRCFDELPEKPRRALGARLNSHGMSDADLAAAVRMKLNTFFQNIRRARQHLAECLKRHGVLIGGDG